MIEVGEFCFVTQGCAGMISSPWLVLTGKIPEQAAGKSTVRA